ncbi:MAG: hypothetical protein ACI4QR_02935, partial [Eubacteriales bacterium]
KAVIEPLFLIFNGEVNLISHQSLGGSEAEFFCLLFFERSYLFAECAEEAENQNFFPSSGECGAKFFCLLFFERKVGAVYSVSFPSSGECGAEFFCLLFSERKVGNLFQT